MGSITRELTKKDWDRLLDECTSRSTIDRYRILREPYSQEPVILGTGGFAQVIKAEDPHQSNRIVAIKQISKSVIRRRNHEKFVLSEIKIHSQLSHDRIVKMYEAFHDDNYVYIVTEYCAGGDLAQYLLSCKTVSPRYAASVMFQLADAIDYLRSEKKDQYGRIIKRAIIHRDLKLSNVLLDSLRTNVKIADFGLATEIIAPGQRQQTFCGTPSCMAPEVFMGKPYSKEVDEYGLGSILYTMLVGQLPTPSHGLPVYESFRKNFAKFRVDMPDSVPADAADLIQGLLCSNTQNRLCVNDIRYHKFIQRYFPLKSSTVSPDSGCPSDLKSSLSSRRYASHSLDRRLRQRRSNSSRSPSSRHNMCVLSPVQETAINPQDFRSGSHLSRRTDQFDSANMRSKIDDIADAKFSSTQDRLQGVPPFQRSDNILNRGGSSSRIPLTAPRDDQIFRPSRESRLNSIGQSTEMKIVRDKKGECLRDKTTPLQAVRLKPYRAKTPTCVCHILPDGDICLEQLSSEDESRVILVLLISPDGLEIVVYAPQSDDGKPGVRLSDTSPARLNVSNLRQRTERYKFDELPVEYWKSYRWASCIIDLIREQTPKVIYYMDCDTFILMENGDFEARLVDGRIVKKLCSKPAQANQFLMKDKSTLKPAQVSRHEEETMETALNKLILLEKLGAQSQIPGIFPMRCGTRPNRRK